MRNDSRNPQLADFFFYFLNHPPLVILSEAKDLKPFSFIIWTFSGQFLFNKNCPPLPEACPFCPSDIFPATGEIPLPAACPFCPPDIFPAAGEINPKLCSSEACGKEVQTRLRHVPSRLFGTNISLSS